MAGFGEGAVGLDVLEGSDGLVGSDGLTEDEDGVETLRTGDWKLDFDMVSTNLPGRSFLHASHDNV